MIEKLKQQNVKLRKVLQTAAARKGLNLKDVFDDTIAALTDRDTSLGQPWKK